MKLTANTREFNLDLNRFIEKMEGNVELAVKKIAFDVFFAVVRKTPVDTGRARASWNVGVGRPDLSVEPRRIGKANPSVATNDALIKAKNINKVKLGQTIYLTNNLPYILRLEHGSSKQSPSGMVRVTVSEFRAGLLGRSVRKK